jgi:hypothetical protein
MKQALKADKQHEPAGDWQHAVDPSHLDPRQRDRGLIAHLLHEIPAIIKKHDMKSQNEKLGDNLDPSSGARYEPVYDHVESDVAAAVRRHNRSVKG